MTLQIRTAVYCVPFVGPQDYEAQQEVRLKIETTANGEVDSFDRYLDHT